MKITVAGLGYVGLSLACALAKSNQVTAVDILPDRVTRLNQKQSPLNIDGLNEYLNANNLNLKATDNAEEAYSHADFVIIAVPTDYDPKLRYFNTAAVENVIEQVLKYCPGAIIVIKSTVPLGYTEGIRKKYNCKNILFSPEFLRESNALYDTLNPDRIIVGTDLQNAELSAESKRFAELLRECTENKDAPIMLTGFCEAEAIKLFSNAYLALRVAYFNEIDTYAASKGLNIKQIIEGICADPRIGDVYNNPGFGYGGYCLPKDTRQLLENYGSIPQEMIKAVVKSNDTRKAFIADKILELLADKSATVGIYRLQSKYGSGNFRESPVLDIIKKLKEQGVRVIIYEPLLQNGDIFLDCEVVNDLTEFKNKSRLIAANRTDSNLDDVRGKVYSRAVFERD